jgi:DNA ligase 1
MDGLTDSFDLVPIAAWFGKGKRTGFYGAYLLACYDPDEEVYQAITKVGTGFSEEMLLQLTEVRAYWLYRPPGFRLEFALSPTRITARALTINTPVFRLDAV